MKRPTPEQIFKTLTITNALLALASQLRNEYHHYKVYQKDHPSKRHVRFGIQPRDQR